MVCCTEPDVHQDSTHSSARCRSCGFGWTFTFQGKGRAKSKVKKWGPQWFCQDDYDRSWRLRGFDRHEVVGTRRRGKREEYVIGCPKFGSIFTASTESPPDEVYCPDCERSGLLGPMLNRYRERLKDEKQNV